MQDVPLVTLKTTVYGSQTNMGLTKVGFFCFP